MTDAIWRARKNERPQLDPSRTELEKLRADDWFRYRAGPELPELQSGTLAVCREVNARYAEDPTAMTAAFAGAIESCGDGLDIRPPILIEYGERVSIGSNVFINNDFMVLGSGRVTIGDGVLIGPGARLYTPNHPVDVELRREGWEIGLPITIEDDAWLGGSVVICPGVTIGARSVVGAGSVVTKDVPPDVVVGGNPARILRKI
ncbi:sugar O-acetyltransferase [Demequina lutea]|uniref:Maltose O-acetyltransferase n=1 Tax=Demequina lutea TaxID=431489 RepID=A0A7Y9ZBA6_9MICO|nr:sugar O-acetyltransferase [Demequina lutea]NYI41675.1 maltose O-acetyltransferase [Demequina lutea]